MNQNDDDEVLNSICVSALEVDSIYANHAICKCCAKSFMFVDGEFGIFKSKSLICCPYCDAYDIRSCDLIETVMKRNLFWR